MSRNPFEFHVRYYWTRASGGIKFEILNPDYEFDWSLPVPEPGSPISGLRARSRRLAVGCFEKDSLAKPEKPGPEHPLRTLNVLSAKARSWRDSRDASDAGLRLELWFEQRRYC